MSYIAESISPSKIDLETLQVKTVHLVVFGHGNVGGKFIEQLFQRRKQLLVSKNLDFKIVAIANSKKVLLNPDGIDENWRYQIECSGKCYTREDVLNFTNTNQFENLIAIDNTADTDFTDFYEALVAANFNIVSSNKHRNTRKWNDYVKLRETLRLYRKEYLYETNVGAGLPLIDTISLLHQSGENITRIKGVFSGSLSYIFNEFSSGDLSFSTVLKRAIANGFTEPDPREDLCGMDVARKLLILARELELEVEISDVSVQNLVPKQLRKKTKQEFLESLADLDSLYLIKKKNLKKNQVLRYVADLHGDLSKNDGGILEVSLQETLKNTMLGQLKGSDSIFEIYTESYGHNPIVIQGAGAGAAVTARGVFGDVLRISNKL